MYGILVMMQQLLEIDLRVTGAIEIVCDGCLVLEQLWSKKTINPFATHSDLLNACKNMKKDLPCTVAYSHIKGHQDKGYPMVLSRLAWLNIEADLEAKAHIDAQHHGHLDYNLPNKPWHIKIAGQ